MKLKKEKSIPLINYILVFIMSIVVIVICIVGTKINNNYQLNKIKISPLVKLVKEYKLSDIESINVIENKNKYIYLSYTNDKNIYNLDNNLKKIITKNKLKDQFFYVNLNKNEKSINELNTMFNLNEEKIIDLPCIIYYRNNNVQSVITSNKYPFHHGSFSQLLDIYEITND